MKEDAPAAPHPPKKRYQLERALDLHLAIWATDEALPAAERAKAQTERERRKLRRPDQRVGVLVDQEGVTQPQFNKVAELVSNARPTEIHHPWASRAIHTFCKRTGAAVTVHQDVRDRQAPLRSVVLSSDMVFAAPRAPGSPAWEAARYAKHRSLPVTIVLPNGSVEGEL